MEHTKPIPTPVFSDELAAIVPYSPNHIQNYFI